MRKLVQQQNYCSEFQEDFYHELKMRQLEYLDLIRDLHDENKKLKKKLEEKQTEIQSITSIRNQNYQMCRNKQSYPIMRENAEHLLSKKIYPTPESSVGFQTPKESSFQNDNSRTQGKKPKDREFFQGEIQECRLPAIKSEELFKNILRKRHSRKELESSCKSIEIKNGEVYIPKKQKNESLQKVKHLKMIDPEKKENAQRKQTPDISICEVIPQVLNEAQPDSFSLFRSDPHYPHQKDHQPKHSFTINKKKNLITQFILANSPRSHQNETLSPKIIQKKQPRIMNKIYL